MSELSELYHCTAETHCEFMMFGWSLSCHSVDGEGACHISKTLTSFFFCFQCQLAIPSLYMHVTSEMPQIKLGPKRQGQHDWEKPSLGDS